MNKNEKNKPFIDKINIDSSPDRYAGSGHLGYYFFFEDKKRDADDALGLA